MELVIRCALCAGQASRLVFIEATGENVPLCAACLDPLIAVAIAERKERERDAAARSGQGES